MNKYLTIATLILIAACSKNKEDNQQNNDPIITNFQVTLDNSLGSGKPKISFTLSNVDTGKIATLYINRMAQNGIYPNVAVEKIDKPTSKDYSILDKNASYPFAVPSEYYFAFMLKDSTYAGIKVFQVH